MPIETLSIPIPLDTPQQTCAIQGYRIGNPAGKKAYLHAGLHSDEHPGILVLHHFLSLLSEAEQSGNVRGCFTIFPVINPLGLSQIMNQGHSGRYDLRSGQNHNRGWPDLFAAIEAELQGKLVDDEAENVTLVRTLVKRWIDALQPRNAKEHLRKNVLGLACDADYVLDLHCDDEALVHLFITPQSLDELSPLSAWIGSHATLMAEDSGGGSFDEVWTGLWIKLQRAFPEKPIPIACHGATIEYRGRGDVWDSQAREDAERLYAFFQEKEMLAGNPATRPEPLCQPTLLTAQDDIRAPHPGLLIYRVELGQRVKRGEIIAELLRLDGDRPYTDKTMITSNTDGVVFSRKHRKYVWTGRQVAKVAGEKPLSYRTGMLHSD